MSVVNIDIISGDGTLTGFLFPGGRYDERPHVVMSVRRSMAWRSILFIVRISC